MSNRKLRRRVLMVCAAVALAGATALGLVVGMGGTADDGKVVFCNRTYARTTSGFTEQETISDYLNTREANAFNWASLDSGNGIHTIAVKGEFTKTATNGTASAIIGNRTLVVDPTKVQNQ